MRAVATVTPMGAGSVKLPLDTDDLVSGGWVGETETRSDTATPEVGMQEIFAREQYVQPVVTQKFLDDATINVEQYLAGKIADKFARVENTAFVSGIGVARPRGFLSYSSTATTEDDADRAWGLVQYVPTGAAGAFPTLSGGASDADSLIDLQMKLKPEYLPRAVWLMRRSMAAVIRKFKDGEGRHLWLDSLTEGGRPLLLGHAVRYFEDMPALASDAFPVAFGDLAAGYGIFDRFGVRIIRDNLTTKGKVKFYSTKRTGGDVRDFDAIKLLKAAVS